MSASTTCFDHLSPALRRGLTDTTYQLLQTATLDQLLRWTADPANRVHLTPAWIIALHRLDPQRAATELPYLVTRPWQDRPIGSVEDIMTLGQATLTTYDDAPLLLARDLCIPDGTDDAGSYPYGLTSFVSMFDQPHHLVVGDRTRIPEHTLWWRPGAPRADVFHLPGHWGFGTTEHPPIHWSPVTCPTVYAFNAPNNWDIDDVDGLVVGCLDPHAFYQTTAWAAFDPDHGDADYDHIHRCFEESCNANIRHLIGDCVTHWWTLDHVWTVLRDRSRSDARIETIAYHYDAQATRPSAMTVTQADGMTTRITFFA